jgi:hypothetical protein
VAIQIFPGLLHYVRNDDLCKGLLNKEGFAVTLSPSKGLGFVIASETTQSRKNLWIATLPSVVRDDVQDTSGPRYLTRHLQDCTNSARGMCSFISTYFCFRIVRML